MLRNGQRVVTVDAAGATPRELARLMTGEERELSVEHRDTSANPPVARAARRQRPQLARPAGAARRDPRRAQRGDPRHRRRVRQRPVRAGRGAHRAAPGRRRRGRRRRDAPDAMPGHAPFAAAGVGNIPEDRIRTGLVRSAPVRDNAILRHYRTPAAVRTGHAAAVGGRRVRQAARRARRRVRTPSLLSITASCPAATSSG